MFNRKKKYDNSSDEDLMRLSAKGQEKAFEALYDRYATLMFRYFCRMLGNDRNKAEDFVQDLFAKIIHQPKAYNPERAFKTWIYSVANNMCKNEYRRLAVRKNTNNSLDAGMDVAGSDHLEPIRAMDSELFDTALREALNQLDDKQREAFIMRYQQEMSIKEIAAVYSCSEGTIKSRLFYTLRKLSEQLKVFNPKGIRT